MGYASRDKRPLSDIAIIDDVAIQKIIDEMPPAGELTPEQLDYIVSQVPSVDISGKVDKVSGKGLSSNDYTDEDKQKVAEGTGGSSGILDCGDFDSGNEGILKIDLGGF